MSLYLEQGDQMNLLQNRQKCSLPEFLSKLIHNFLIHNFKRGKSSPKMWATSESFKKLPKVNNDPIGEKSPNLVTLI
jgi:hypothetical protein